jgi:LPS O-antigen subunit length determinant protein (WzzB/FepE family)
VIVGVLARALARSSRSAVAPTVLLQLICIGEAYNMTQEQKWSYAVVVTVLAVGALGATALGLRQLPTDED